MKQKLLTDIELDVHELKYLMNAFSTEPTLTLSELLKRSILRMQERLGRLSEEVDAVQVIEKCDIPLNDGELEAVVEKDAPVIVENEIVVEEVPKSILVEASELSIVKADESVVVEEDKSLSIKQEYNSPVLGESLKLSEGLRHSISLNDSFRFSRELFGGDSELMNRVVEQISVMSSFKTAVVFLSSKVNIDNENEAMNDLLELLKKYFNQSA